jgi:hypothetical protein
MNYQQICEKLKVRDLRGADFDEAFLAGAKFSRN